MLGTTEANDILLQASELPQYCFDIHLTPRGENAEGSSSSTGVETAKQGKEWEGGKEAERAEGRSINQKQTMCFTVWFVMGA